MQGENSITTWWNATEGKFLMTKRAGKGTCRGATGRGADMCYRFSADGLSWGPFQSPTALWPMMTGSADSSAAVGVPGGMVFIHGGGVALPPSAQQRKPQLGSESGSGGEWSDDVLLSGWAALAADPARVAALRWLLHGRGNRGGRGYGWRHAVWHAV